MFKESVFWVRCPKCKNTMKYSPKGAYLFNKRKRCVYCGFSINVRPQIRPARLR